MKKKIKKKIILTLIAIILIVAAVVTTILLLDIETPDDYYGDDDENENSENIYGKVTLTLDCLEIKDDSAENIPESGYLLENVEVVIEEGDTVLTVLQKAAKKHTIVIDASQGYVTGIGGVYAGDFGDMSGWIYYVNGESPDVGADQYVLSDGDVIKWVFIKDFSKLWE